MFFGLWFLVVSGCVFAAFQFVFDIVGRAVAERRVESHLIAGSVSIHEATSLMALFRVWYTIRWTLSFTRRIMSEALNSDSTIRAGFWPVINKVTSP